MIPPRAQRFRQDMAIVDPVTGYPTVPFLRSINSAIDLVNYLGQLQAATEAAQAAADAADAAAAAANAAAATAQTAADDAQTAADNAQGTASDATTATALANSYPDGVTITATDMGADVTIDMTAHDRVYSTEPPTSVAVSAGDVTGLAYSTTYFIHYDDPGFSGGAVTYLASTDWADAAQVSGNHSVGYVTTPAALGGPETGFPTAPPGGSYQQ